MKHNEMNRFLYMTYKTKQDHATGTDSFYTVILMQVSAASRKVSKLSTLQKQTLPQQRFKVRATTNS